MTLLLFAAAFLVSYLAGSVSFAILIARSTLGVEIRDVGNLNPGAANVVRSINPRWGLVVGVLDTCKAVLPMWLADRFLFDWGGPTETLALFAVGIAAIIGHCKPVFHGFRGGRGAGPMLGVLLYFLRLELVITFVVSTLAVALFAKNVEFRWSRWGPIASIATGPFVVAACAYLGPFTVAGVAVGDYGWPVVAGVFATSIATLLLNLSFMGDRVVELNEGLEE